MRLLDSLALKHKTDKFGEHNYTPNYETHFNKFKDEEVNILEIGIGGYKDTKSGGGSLLMWKEYFTKGNIFGIDIYDKSFLDQDRIKTFKGSQIDEKFLKETHEKIGAIDIIIDDGSHINEHVIKSFKTLFPLLKTGGIYVIEDLQTAYWTTHGRASSVEFLKTLIDGLNHAEKIDASKPSYTDLHVSSVHFYHNIAFIYKGDNTEPSNIVKDNKPNSHTGPSNKKLKLSIWQNYYLPEQLPHLDPGFIPHDNIGKLTKWYEDDIILDVYENEKDTWENSDYVGILSQRFFEKTGLTYKDIEKFLQNEKEPKPVYLLTPLTMMKNAITTSKIGLRPIQELSKEVDKHSVFPFKVYGYDVEDCLNFCNYWICKPDVFIDYVENYLKPMMKFLDTEPSVQDLVKTTIPHRHKETGLTYQLYPFFLESLFPIYIHHNKIPRKTILPEKQVAPPIRRNPVRNIQISKRRKLLL